MVDVEFAVPRVERVGRTAVLEHPALAVVGSPRRRRRVGDLERRILLNDLRRQERHLGYLAGRDCPVRHRVDLELGALEKQIRA